MLQQERQNKVRQDQPSPVTEDPEHESCRPKEGRVRLQCPLNIPFQVLFEDTPGDLAINPGVDDGRRVLPHSMDASSGPGRLRPAVPRGPVGAGYERFFAISTRRRREKEGERMLPIPPERGSSWSREAVTTYETSYRNIHMCKE